MSISTRSAFYYGHTVTIDNASIDFSEGGPDLEATLNPGSYTLTEYAVEVARALNSAGALTYTVTVNRTTRVLTIAATGNFELLAGTGNRIASGAWTMMGFSASDRTGASSYAGQSGSGSEFLPQAILDNYIPKTAWLQKQDAVVNKAASGVVQSLSFGDVRFYQMNIKYQNNNNPSKHPDIEVDTDGYESLAAFMEYCISKAPIEFMPNRASRSTFDKLLLEKTPVSQDGTESILEKLESVAGFYNSGILIFRVVN